MQNHVRPGVTSIETSTMSGIHLDRLEGVTSMGKDLQDGQSWHAIPSEKMGAPSIFTPFQKNWRPAHFSPLLPRAVASLGSFLSGFVPYMVCIWAIYLGPEVYRQFSVYFVLDDHFVCVSCQKKKYIYIYIYMHTYVIFFMNKKADTIGIFVLVFFMFWR